MNTFKTFLKYIWLLSILFLFTEGNCQEICVGSLGENIFTEGDFGSGEENILPIDPGIAPGFIYTSNTPFDDGFYTITNGSNRWSSNYATWLNIGDASTDPNGYMMVVNASFSPGIFYNQEVDELCDNTTYNFTADVINMIRSSVSDHILPNVSFLIDGEVKFTTGPIPQDELWHTYGFSFITEPGQTSVELTLRNNAPGGIGNDLALDNISFRACGPDAIASTDLDGKVCENSFENVFMTANIIDAQPGYALQWQVSSDNGTTWTDISGANDTLYQITDFSSGFFLYRYQFGASEENLQNSKCRTLSTPQPLEVVPLTYTVNDTFCQGTVYHFGQTELEQSGTYVDSLISSIGCDSIVTLHLVQVSGNSIQFFAEGTDPSCTDFVDGVVIIDSIVGAGYPVIATMNNTPIDPFFDVPGLSSGEYLIQIVDRFGCMADTQIILNNPPPFVAIGQVDTTLRLGQTIVGQPVFSQPPTEWIWNPIAGLSCADCPDPMITPLRTTNYQVLAKNEFGCEAIFIYQIQINVDEIIFIPNVFTPNGDNLNDYFGAFGDAQAQSEIYKVSIYDRFGGLIYYNDSAILNQPQTGWDGKSAGNNVSRGVYSYFMRFTLINSDEIQKSGTITILR